MSSLINFDVIPDRSHTFSKAHHQYPTDLAPTFVLKASGVTLTTDKGDFTDWSMGLGPVIKGYNFQELNDFIAKKINDGFAYSIPSEYEFIVASKLLKVLEFGEQVRFAKNGSDVTSAAVRLSRYHTGKTKVICNGYHGWQDWYIGSTTRNGGVPDSISSETIKIDGPSIEQLEKAFTENKENVACLIVEPMVNDEPNIAFLENAKRLCKKNSSLLIFDECWTGFRCHRQGAIGYTSIEPDLACYAKALGNGIPVSAIVGNKIIMKDFEEIFFSFTHASDPIGIAAADFMLDYLDKDFFLQLNKKTTQLFTYINDAIKNIKNPELRLSATSYPGKIALFAENQSLSLQIKTFIQMELLKKNILFNMFFAISEDHKKEHIDSFIKVLNTIIKKFNTTNFNINKETEKYLVSPVFRKQK